MARLGVQVGNYAFSSCRDEWFEVREVEEVTLCGEASLGDMRKTLLTSNFHGKAGGWTLIVRSSGEVRRCRWGGLCLLGSVPWSGT
jgi:hypothetical protein